MICEYTSINIGQRLLNKCKPSNEGCPKKAMDVWNKSAPAPSDHPYLVDKRISPHKVKIHSDSLIIPIGDNNEIISLQIIDPNGVKTFFSGARVRGGYYPIGKIHDAKIICIAEGFATAATIHEATKYTVVVAFNAGNLVRVAKTIRDRLPNATMIICADDDAKTHGNPGISSAIEAARTVNGVVAVPEFGMSRRERDTDFNDMANLLKQESVSSVINKAIRCGSEATIASAALANWEAPLPIGGEEQSKPYPLESLPKIVREAVEEVIAFTKAPVVLAASSALSVLSLAIQGHVDVARADKLSGSVGLFLLTIADSSERKSTCDKLFIKPILDYEEKQSKEFKRKLNEYKASQDAWSVKSEFVKTQIRQLMKKKMSTEEMEKKLSDLEQNKPELLILTDSVE